MTKLAYHILRVPSRPDFVKCATEPEDMDKLWLLDEGEPYAKLYPKGVSIQVDKKHKGTKLDDFIANPMQWLLVTERVRDLLEEQPVKLEMFPMGVKDKKGKKVAQPYFLAHLLGTVDCVDLKKSVYDRSAFEPELVHTFEKLVLDPKRIPPEATLFRIKEQSRTKIIRSDLVERLRKADVTGFELWELNAPIML